MALSTCEYSVPTIASGSVVVVITRVNGPIVNVDGPETAPTAFCTVTLAVPPVAMRLAATFAVSDVALL